MPRQPALAKLTSPSVCIYVLGTLRVENAGTRLRLPKRKIEPLLAYLALYRGEHTREKLAALFWGDYPDAAARASLRNALPFLRKAFGPHFLLTDRETIQLNPRQSVWVDALEFAANAEQFLASDSEDQVMVNLELYQGELLPD